MSQIENAIIVSPLDETEQDNYIPYGEEWVKAISKLPKAVIIEMFKTVALERDILRQDIAALEGYLPNI